MQVAHDGVRTHSSPGAPAFPAAARGSEGPSGGTEPHSGAPDTMTCEELVLCHLGQRMPGPRSWSLEERRQRVTAVTTVPGKHLRAARDHEPHPEDPHPT